MLIAAAAVPARAQTATADPPILRIETGTHTAVVLGLAVAPDGKQVVTASDDTTLRLWSLPELELQRTIRLPIGAGTEGEAFAVAYSSDGKQLVTTGWTGSWNGDDGPWCFYVIDAMTGDIGRSVCDLPQRINQIGFSPDGQYVVAVMKAAAPKQERGLRVYRTSDYSLYRKDTDYGDSAIAFDFIRPTGMLVTSSLDGKLRLYDKNFTLIKAQTLPEGRKPHGISVSPDGSRVAVGYAEPEANDPPWQPAVDVLSSVDLSVLPRPDVRGMANGALWRVAWSPDGQFLFAGGTWEKGERFPVRRWSDGGQGRPLDNTGTTDRIIRMIGAAQGILIGTETGGVGVLGFDDQLLREQAPATADFTDIADILAISRDATTVQFALEPGGHSVMHFSLTTRLLEAGEAPSGATPAHPITDSQKLDVRDWAWSYAPTLNGKPLAMRVHDQSLSLTLLNNDEGVLLGTSWQLIRYDPQGKALWTHEIFGNVRGVVVTPDNRIAVAAIGDGTLRWYALDTGRELLALFPHPDGRRWVVWTPSGYYMASADGDALIGWQVNRGRQQVGDFFPVGRFEDQYLRPDIVTKTLALRDEQKAIRAAAADGKAGASKAVVQMLPPVIDIVSQQPTVVTADKTLRIAYRVRTPSGAPIKQITARVDGHLLGPFAAPPVDAGGTGAADLVFPLPQHDTDIMLFAENEFGASEPAKVAVQWHGERTDPGDAPHKVHILAVGVSKYADREIPALSYAAKDADDFVRAVEQQSGKAFTAIDKKVLTNEEATLANVRAGLAWLDQQSGPDDISMLYLAGHGFNEDDGTYYYLPRDADLDKLATTALPNTELLAALKGSAGYAILFIDTCYAGAVAGPHGGLATEVDALVNRIEKLPKGIIVYAATTAEKPSDESDLWRNGAFTHVLVEGFDGQWRDKDRDYVTTTMLAYHVKESIKDLTAGEQTATVELPIGVPDLLMARVGAK